MPIREIKLFQVVPQASIPVIPVPLIPPHYSRGYIYNDYEPETTTLNPDAMVSEDIPWYLKPDNKGLKQEIYDASDRTKLYSCKNCGIIPAIRERRYVVKQGAIHLACSPACATAIINKKAEIK
jgi:hypothetical protein